MAKNLWIQDINMKKGSLTNAAKKAGVSLDEYCSKENLDSKTKKRCVLRKTLMGFRKGKK